MRREKSKSYLFLFITLFLIMIIPPTLSEKLRVAVFDILHPVLEKLTSAKFNAQNLNVETIEAVTPLNKVTNITLNEEIKRLELENKLLYANFIQLQGLVENEDHIVMPSQAVAARVIFRSPSSWYSTLWINLGENDNHALKNHFIGKNSPVLIGDSIIGVIDYIGKKQSRVRLISDSGLNPSVRALRQENDATHYLAKGELRGTGSPLFRSNGNLLYGIGFNYDFEDDKGPARDLRTGELKETKEKSLTLPLLKVGDLLVTTGMDGVFPPDLNVAKITKIYPLKEGDYYYELEAEPTCGKLDDISLVFVLPPVGFDFNDQPPLIGR
jgi:cell shape-determining protein MreC